jgi:predicted Mrr-cat superfamily restriction endonuclease
MNYWLHRISHHAEVSYPLLKQGILSIGWSDFSEEEYIERCSNNWEKFEKAFIDEGWDLSKSRYSLWRFISEMKKGDIVLVPSWGTFSLFELIDDAPFSVEKLDINSLKDWNGNNIIKSGYLYRNDDSTKDNIVDLGFFRNVKPVMLDIPRNEYADQVLTSRMKIRTTNANITDLNQSINNAIKSFEFKKPINLHSLIVEKANHDILSLIRTQLNPDKFELLIKWYFEKSGASNVMIPSKNESGKEGDADIVATFDTIRTIIYVQAKYHVGETSAWALEQINDYRTSKDSMDDGYAKTGWVISSGDNFSEECYETAKDAHVILINGAQFATMLLNIGISELENAF